MIYHYEWSGYKYPVEAETVGKHCRAIEERDGTITKKSFLDSARDENTPVHNLFEWNDEIAGEKYRLYQAGNILSALKVTVITEKKEPVQTKAFIQVAREDQIAKYLSTSIALSQENTRNSVLEIAKRELFTFMEKYRILEELGGVIAEIEKLKVS